MTAKEIRAGNRAEKKYLKKIYKSLDTDIPIDYIRYIQVNDTCEHLTGDREMTTAYQVKVGKTVRMTFAGDFAQASSPLTIDGNSTPFQVADARHRPAKAAQILNDWCRSEGGEAWGEDEEIEIVEK